MELELLSPAGTPEKLRFAAEYGADAVYAGAPGFSLRGGAETFTLDDFASSLSYLHQRNKKLFLAANAFFHNDDLPRFREFLKEAVPLGFDGIILSDLGMIGEVREAYPDLDVHVSTQANTTNQSSAKFYQKLGVKRIVLARELNLGEIKQIRDAVDLELEAFVHGAMCISYSGRCLLSNHFSSQRDANRGDCTQVCRWEFALAEKKRPGEYLPVEQDSFGTAILSSKDLNLSASLGDLIDAGVQSFKIEGRMKSVLYAAATARVYRHALDRARDGLSPDPNVLSNLNLFNHREYSTGFFYEDQRFTNANQALSADSREARYVDHQFLAVVEEVKGDRIVARAMNPVRCDGRKVLTLTPGGDDGWLREFQLAVEGESRTMVRPTERFELRSEESAIRGLRPYSLLVQGLEA